MNVLHNSLATLAIAALTAGASHAQTDHPANAIYDGLTLGIEINTDEMCEIADPDPIFGNVVASLDAHGLGFERESEDTTSMVQVSVRVYGSENHGCSAFAAVELLQQVDGVAVDYSDEPFSGWVTLGAFYSPMVPTGLTGDAFNTALAQWLGEDLFGLWGMLLEDQDNEDE
ncbi:hypothetical protein [Glycocaulis abyssi]|uniref:Uncharacterized protein n=1 Tax=Glycocaulis abyssi TaxID=1433403 RepID=A0ABV9N732_9PROT